MFLLMMEVMRVELMYVPDIDVGDTNPTPPFVLLSPDMSLSML